MKNLLLLTLIAMLTAGCSSGTTVADLPNNLAGTFTGTFQSTDGNQVGEVTIDISSSLEIIDGRVEDAGTVAGNLIFSTAQNVSNCLRSAPVSDGATNGFNITLAADQAGFLFTTTVTERMPNEVDVNGVTTGEGALVSEIATISTTGVQGTQVSTLPNGNIQTIMTDAPVEVTGTLTLQLTIINGGAALQGTYTSTGNVCPAGASSGSLLVSR